MSDLQPKSEGEIFPERTTTSFMLDRHFSECSMSASNVNSLAHEQLIEEKLSVPQQAFVIDKSGFGEEFAAQRFLATAAVDHPENKALRFALATSRGENKSPRLIAFFNGDLAVQVAAFETRQDDRCNFVQLGQEFQDKNYVAHTSDHSRLEYIHAIKALLNGSQNKDQLTLLADLATSEINLINPDALDIERTTSRHREANRQTEAALIRTTEQAAEARLHTASICKKVIEQIKEARSTRQRHIMLANGDDAPSKVMLETRFPNWTLPLDDGRNVELVLLQASSLPTRVGALVLKQKPRGIGHGDITLAVKVKEDIAVPLYVFSKSGKYIHESDGNPVSQEDLDVIQRAIQDANSTGITAIRNKIAYLKSETYPIDVYGINTELSFLKDKEQQALRGQDPFMVRWWGTAIEHTLTALEMLDPNARSNYRYYFGDSQKRQTRPEMKEVFEKFWQTPFGSAGPQVGDPVLSEIYYLDQEISKLTRCKHPLRVPIIIAAHTKELQDALRNPKYAQVALLQHANTQEKIEATIGKYQPQLETLKSRLDTLSQRKKTLAKGKYFNHPTSTGNTNLDVEVEIDYKDGMYKFFVYLTPDGQRGKKEPLTRFGEKEGEEVYLTRPNTLDDDEIIALLDLLEVVHPSKHPVISRASQAISKSNRS